jgi:hypothetical protein
MDLISKILVSENYAFIALVLVGVFILWFLPAMLALIFNRKQFKLIILACIPAGLSFIAWGGVLLWAICGRAVVNIHPKWTLKIRNNIHDQVMSEEGIDSTSLVLWNFGMKYYMNERREKRFPIEQHRIYDHLVRNVEAKNN